MVYVVTRYLLFILAVCIWNFFYFNIYGNKKIMNKLLLALIFLVQLVILTVCCICDIHSKPSMTFILYIINLLPLIAYKDKTSNKLYIYCIILGFCLINEIFATIILMFTVAALQMKFLLPVDMLINHSMLTFIPIFIMFLFDFFEAYHIKIFLKYIKNLDLKKNIILIIISILCFNICFGILCYTTLNRFILDSILFIVFLFINLIILNININNFLIKYNKYTNLRYYQKILQEQSKFLESIDEYFKKTRKKNHDFVNHLIIVENLIENEEKKAKLYLDKMLKKYKL